MPTFDYANSIPKQATGYFRYLGKNHLTINAYSTLKIQFAKYLLDLKVLGDYQFTKLDAYKMFCFYPGHPTSIDTPAIMPEPAAAIAITTVISLLAIVDIAGNILVCAIIKRNRDMRYAETKTLDYSHNDCNFFLIQRKCKNGPN